LIGFDADDTLWHNESLYQLVRQRFRATMATYQIDKDFEARVDAIEIQNLPAYGYGAMGFILSLIEAGIEGTNGALSTSDVRRLLDWGKEMLTAPVQLFEHVEETLKNLSIVYPLMLITKGDLNHQLSKLEASGLKKCFQYVEVVHDKTPEVYASILARAGIQPAQFVMVGNSLRSDILPVLEIGGWGIHIPHDLTWSHEQVEVPAGCCDRYSELSNLSELEAFLNRIQLTMITNQP